ncbi:MAG: 30S ribosomal protein S12 methylthiotransferase RimO [Leptospiraceae bacterium]|nr:30S ribosomal protein S12 methylthiotransferase RimO [Leptospiraceae bacterium]MCP5495171.1 30S ribosomal protein S12 methylthiotransferase RimO [Leptospiraceae bacterium]
MGRYKNNQKTFYITTLGCPKNTADSMHMQKSLLTEGLRLADSPENSDFHLVNTCTFIQSANEETIETILEAGNIKRNKKNKLIVVGCFAERYGEIIGKELPEVDYYWGTKNFKEAGNLIKKSFPNEFHLSRLEDSKLKETFNTKPYTFVKISDGCNRDCHFCIIPKIRGKFRDTPEEDIIQDCKEALVRGAKEICLVSQDSVFYGKSNELLYNLIQKITDLPGLELLRFLYLYPDKKTLKLLDVFKTNPKIVPYLESPLQHVSENLLKAMNRTGSYTFFKDLFLKAREIPGLEIRTSFILGYPGETSKDVDEIIRFVTDLKPEKLALFSFSPQEGTVAYNLKDVISDKEIAKRVNLVRNVHLELLKEIHQKRIGKIYNCIVDEISEGTIIARRFQDAPEIDEVVYLESDLALKPGDIGSVKIESFSEYDMDGVWISE